MHYQLDFVSALTLEMSQYEMYIDYINMLPGKYHRFKSRGICKHKCCEYRIFERQLGAQFRCFSRNINRYWFFKDKKTWTKSEHISYAEERKKIEREIEQRIRFLRQRAWKLFKDYATDVDASHPYLIKKKIIPYGAYKIRDSLLLPITDINRTFMTNQYITHSSFKRFAKGIPTKGGVLIIGDVEQNNEIVLVCEGWATGCSLFECTDLPVFVAFYASNLANVVAKIKSRYANSCIIICADNDCYKKDNVGLNTSSKIANAYQTFLAYPNFNCYNLNVRQKLTDFNDLHSLCGAQAVQECILNYTKGGIMT